MPALPHYHNFFHQSTCWSQSFCPWIVHVKVSVNDTYRWLWTWIEKKVCLKSSPVLEGTCLRRDLPSYLSSPCWKFYICFLWIQSTLWSQCNVLTLRITLFQLEQTVLNLPMGNWWGVRTWAKDWIIWKIRRSNKKYSKVELDQFLYISDMLITVCFLDIDLHPCNSSSRWSSWECVLKEAKRAKRV